ncbi:MAG: DNA methyltransferase [Sulfurimonas sp.]
MTAPLIKKHDHLQKKMEEVGFTINNILVMVKNNAVTNQHYMKNCEFTIFARKGGSKGLNDFGLKSAMMVTMPFGENKIHDTEKPLSYVKTLISNSTKPGDIVADFFAGSGNVANACVDLGLDFICCEIDEKWHTQAVDRLERANGNVGLFA